MFGYENELVFPIFISEQKFVAQKWISMDLLLLFEDDKSHYVYIKDFTYLCFIKQKMKTKNGFVKVAYNVLVVKIS